MSALNLLSFQLPRCRQLLPMGLLCAILSVEIVTPAAAIESQNKLDRDPIANVTSDLPSENLVARRRCRYVTRIRRTYRIVRRGPFVFRGRRYGRNYVLRRVTRRPVRVRVCR